MVLLLEIWRRQILSFIIILLYISMFMRTISVAVLPKFEVKIDAPSFFFYRDTLLTFNVGAK